MNDPVDALLALSTTAAAIAETNGRAIQEDDRSSSLSELEDAPDPMDIEDDIEEDDNDGPEPDSDEEDEDEQDQRDNILLQATDNIPDGDSEAETERLEDSPDKVKRTGTFQVSPSKLAQSMNASDDIRPEIEELTNSEASSPITPVEHSPGDDLSEAEDLDELQNPLNLLSQAATVSNKRKRLSDVMDITTEERPRKRRTDSLSDVEDESEPESEPDKPEPATRELTVDPDDLEAQDQEVEEAGPEQAEASDDSKSKKTEKHTRSRSRRGKDPAEEPEDNDNEAELSDDDAEAEEQEITAKSEEEQAQKNAALEALVALENHFATLRDKLYDEKLFQLNHELSQLSATAPTHSELLKQFDCVDKWTEEKQDVEQKRLVFRVESLKRESVARRSQIHSAYLQTVRDIRERHMENMAEHFYRIQRERFRAAKVTPTYTIPFPDKKIDQVIQQTAYNKEVSILSGVAKYVGFPAAPALAATSSSDLDSDLQKMGISSRTAGVRNAAANSHRHNTLGVYPATGAISALSSSAAAANASSEQQFIESTPWANPNHPIHRLGRQSANSSPFAIDRQNNNHTSTPAHQLRRNDFTPQPVGSASTILENASAQPTPGTDAPSSAMKHEYGTIHAQTNGIATSTSTNGDVNGVNVSPSDTRRTINNMLQAGSAAAAAGHQPNNTPGDAMYLGVNSSPLLARASLLSNLNRTASATGMRENMRSPFKTDLVASGGMGRFGFR
ncbi:hypothetical protein LTR05_002098 [Lithohypha guttulata]|uniref:Transcriptional regulatory protein DEP1 n=1 Tax=Lithohypha guttulata TaxID=1690604 RepID=A0AAN7Y7H8_9EURO|nr:hypothetical protein LTR05_002098 [Lithohypha guttulata]